MFLLDQVEYQDILKIPKLSIGENTFTSIVGESGSGKSTLLRLLNKLISPTKGSIFYKGHNLKEIPSQELRKKVIMLGQEPIIFPNTIEDNLRIGRQFAKMKEPTEEEMLKALKFIELNKPLQEICSNLSGGEKQRLALARILLLDPSVLLLDEPSAALDEDSEEKIMDRILDYAETRNISLIVVTHSRAIYEKYSDQIIPIKNGQIESSDLI